MNDSRSVFESILKDIEAIQIETAKLAESRSNSELETHLSERIALISENSIEASAAQRKIIQSLNDKVDDCTKKIKKNKKK